MAQSWHSLALALVFTLAILVGISSGRSLRQTSGAESFFGQATSDLAIAILKNDVGNNTNLVFSPLGYSAILAILAEGARGNTRNQLVKALRLPEDTYAVRSTYKSVLSNMQEHYVINKPEFKNWFYVYKNYSVEQSYRKVLSESYLTNVKEIERDYHYSTSSSSVKDENKKEKENENDKKSENDNMNKEQHSGSESEKSKETNATENNDKVLKSDSLKVEDKVEGNKKKSVVENGKKNEVVNARNMKDGGEVQMEKEILSALSANRLSSVQQTQKGDGENNEEKSDSRMIIFNALYFRGNWSVPFTRKGDKKEAFYLSETEKKQVEMISSEGEFEYGQVTELDATAIELPYQGGRYSLLLLLPNSRNGLNKLISSLTRDCLKDINKYLSKTPVEVCIPKFKFYSISRPKNALTKCGVTDIFNDEADLSGITGMKGLYLDDLVQLVTLEVDESSSSYNFLTSSAVETRSAVVKFKADQPFLFFLRDRVDNFVVVAGRLRDPTHSNEELTS